jgi:hypothetical protein
VGGSAGFADRDTTEGIDTLLRRPVTASGHIALAVLAAASADTLPVLQLIIELRKAPLPHLQLLRL